MSNKENVRLVADHLRNKYGARSMDDFTLALPEIMYHPLQEGKELEAVLKKREHVGRRVRKFRGKTYGGLLWSFRLRAGRNRK